MFCAIATTIERCKTEGVVDVFQVVKALRVQKPGAVRTVVGLNLISAHEHTIPCSPHSPPPPTSPHLPSQEQFCTVFEAVLVYLDSFDTYANFQDL